MLENRFKTKLIKELELIFPGIMVFHLNPNEVQGIPDLILFYEDKWAALEGKKSATSPKRPNQDYYVNKMNNMSFARFVFPENKEEVVNELKEFFSNRSRVSESQ